MIQKVLIEQIIHSTAVLLAEVSTMNGARTPLSDIFDLLFMDISAHLEQKGITRKVIADMFGMSTRTFQRRVHRIREFKPDEKTIWMSVIGYIHHSEGCGRQEIIDNFLQYDEGQIISILNDLIANNVIAKTDKGYTETSKTSSFFHTLCEEESLLVWAHVYRHGPMKTSEISEDLHLPIELAEQIIASLVEQNKASYLEAQDAYTCRECYIPVGSVEGFYASMFEHYGTVIRTMITRLHNISSKPTDQSTGMSTISFNVFEGHVHYEDVTGILADFREQVNRVWYAVLEENKRKNLPREGVQKVEFYMGQNIYPLDLTHRPDISEDA
ncbi:MAG: helix-turn-helix domain-containing protein [Bradymonadia bacterium]